LSFFSWTRGKGGSPRLLPCQNPLPLLCFRPPTPTPTPMNGRRLCWPSCLTPPRRDTTRPPHARPRHRHGHREHQIKAEHHRPSPEPSLCHQPCDDTLDQFPELVWPEPYCAAHPDRARLTPPSRPECTERATCSRAPAPRLASLSTRTCTASSPRHHDTLALHRRALKRPRRAPFLLQRH
jgi:hypothetical protein